jgi:site-specific DNA-adenine methylase
MLRPFFSYYGSKWLAVSRGWYPEPSYQTIIEPFAGSACYSLRWHWHSIELYDLDPVICGIWDYLINAKPSEILALPLLQAGQHIDELGPLQAEARNLIGFWINKASTTPKRTMGKWCAGGIGSIWDESIKNRIADQLEYIRHWKIKNESYSNIKNKAATWYIDPPYHDKGKYYRCSSSSIDFEHLGSWSKQRQGEIIVCEQVGADWLPFVELGDVESSQFKDGRRMKSKEAIYTTAKHRQLVLFS